MEVKIKHNEELLDATIEVIDGVMVVTPKNVDKEEVDYSQFKDGDIITCGWEKKTIFCEWVCVLRGQIEVVESNLYIEDYCSLDLKSNTGECKLTATSSFSDTATYVRYATEEEKQKLFDALAKEGKMWDAEKKEVMDLRWKPKSNEYYVYVAFAVYTGFLIGSDYWDYSEDHVQRQERGWAFPNTKEGKSKCQALCDKLNEAIKSVKS